MPQGDAFRRPASDISRLRHSWGERNELVKGAALPVEKKRSGVPANGTSDLEKNPRQ